MSIESKIKELLGRSKDADQLNEEGMAPMGAASVTKDTSIKAANQGDTTPPMQGSSQKADYEEREETEENQGSVAAKSTPSSPRPANTGAGNAPNYTTVADPTSVVNMQASSGNKPMGEETQEAAPSLKEQLTAIFGDDLSEDFRDKATAIFEAAVIARVNEEMEKVTTKLEEQSQVKLEEMTEGLIDKVDSFMNYVVEQWMEENKLAVEGGLRTEIAEDFITGLKSLFQEHYIEVPEDKVDVVEELQSTSEQLEEKLNDTLTKNIELAEELSNLKKAIVLSEMSADLASTEAEKLGKLIEGVSFDNDGLFREKVKVIKENYFPKAQKTSPEEQLLNEEAPVQQTSDAMSKYVQALSKAIKAR
jgi:hypothetical protein